METTSRYERELQSSAITSIGGVTEKQSLKYMELEANLWKILLNFRHGQFKKEVGIKFFVDSSSKWSFSPIRNIPEEYTIIFSLYTFLWELCKAEVIRIFVVLGTDMEQYYKGWAPPA